MKNIIIEVDNNSEIIQDFCFFAKQSAKYKNQLHYHEYNIEYKPINNLTIEDKYSIPIGCIQFIHKWFELNEIPIPKPINIPFELNNYFFLNRNIRYGTINDITNFPVFIKPNNDIKLFTGDVFENKGQFKLISELKPDTELLISDAILIESEWRGFIYNKKLVGIKHYLGDFTLCPNFKFIEQIIKSYENSPISYSINIGINDTDNFLIEIHDFYSVGLYGFNDENILIGMFIDWLEEYKNKFV